ncbi:MAG: alkyl sulfatase dimerization domain-containing protein [Acidimicrobiales bacterium]
MNAVELADRLWRGEVSTAEHHPVIASGDLVEVTDGVAFLPSFANVSALTTDDGLLLVDTGSSLTAAHVHEQIRHWTSQPLDTAVFSHGHIDHVFGVGLFEEEARTHGWPAPRVVAHEHVPARFDRYVLTAGYNQVINRRQFGFKDLVWPTEYRYPDEVYHHERTLTIGSLDVHLRHERGETDDATVTWIPSRQVLYTGDLFVWSSPNAGNPQKVQRYPREWAQALRRMSELGAHYLLPGHGTPVIGEQRVHQALSETAQYLESIVDQTLAMMNEGARLSDVLSAVVPPAHLADRPFLQPVYDEPEFIVRNVWRLYGGWWDGNPATLKPASDRRLAAEMADLAGGAARLAARAEQLLDEGTPEGERLSAHLIETAWLAAPDDPAIARARQRIFTVRAERATSTMARGIFQWAARESVGQEY